MLGNIFIPKSYEHLEMLLRQHWVLVIREILAFLFMAAIPLGVVALTQNSFPTLLAGPIFFPIVAVVGSIYYLAIWLFFISRVIDYYLDISVVSNDRIISVDQEALFGRRISELDLWRVQDVTSEVKGITATIFNYGTVYVQTAGQTNRFDFERVPNPHQVREKIIRLADEDRKYHTPMVVE